MTRDFKPYTAIKVPADIDRGEFLEEILLSSEDFQPIKINKPVILYGAGKLGKMAKSFFDYFNIPILYVVDQNADDLVSDDFWKGTKIILPDNVDTNDKNSCLLVICVVVNQLIELQEDLKNKGWLNIVFFYDVSQFYHDQYPLNNGWYLEKVSARDQELIIKVFSALDELSQLYYLQFLAWRKLRVELLFTGLSVDIDNRFFIPEIVSILHNHEVFVDCGAHKGSVTKKFIEIANNCYQAIYAIEPDSGSLVVLKKELTGLANVKIIESALGNNSGKVRFCGGFDFASKICNYGQDEVSEIRLDDLQIDASFIKIHLEGGELEALKGSVNTIEKCRPILAITTYHNSDGVFKIPLFLMNNFSNYQYYFRLHSWGGTGAVLYAIPVERINY